MLARTRTLSLRKEIIFEDSLLTDVFAALGDRMRLRIFVMLLRYEDLCVTDLANVLEISVSAVSQHLRILEQAGLVQRQRQGQRACYYIQRKAEVVKGIARLVERFIKR